MSAPVVETLTLRFDLRLSPEELTRFRGAIHRLLPQGDTLIHNHLEEGLRYAYPLVQYKVLGNKASIVAVNEGIPAIMPLLSTTATSISLGQRKVALELLECTPVVCPIAFFPQCRTYRLRQWLPLNEDNYALYQQTLSLAARISQLDHILVGHLLSFFKGVGLSVEEEIVAYITRLHTTPNPILFKGVRLLAFDVDFACNLSLPTGIGLGKGASRGFGVMTAIDAAVSA